MPQEFNIAQTEFATSDSSLFPDSSAGNGDRPESFTEEQTTMNDVWCQRLEALIKDACAAPPKSETRRKLCDRVIRHLQSRNIPYSQSYDRASNSGYSSSPEKRRQELIHQEAARATWLHFFLNLCECQTRNTQSSYVANEGIHVVRRLRKYYGKRLLDLQIKDGEQRQQEQPFNELDQDGNVRSFEEILAAPPNEPDWHDELCQWIEADESGILRQTHLKNKIDKETQEILEDRTHINAQAILLRRLCANVTWEKIAKEFGVSLPTLVSFYQNRCLPLLREFLEEEGYIDPTPPIPQKLENSDIQVNLLNWLETDPDKKLRDTHVKNRPDITAQLVLLREHKSQDKLKDVIEAIASEKGIEIARLKGFYYRQCKPLLVEFGKSRGYSEE